MLALVTLALGALAVPPGCRRRPARRWSSALVVLGTVTLLAVPVLGRFGARPDNPTLLDRDYTAGWLVLAGLTLVAVVVAAARTLRASAEEVGMARVLVVDDDHTVREVVVSYLRAHEHDVVEAADGEAALSAMRDEPGRPGRARPDAARHRRARGVPPAARDQRRAGRSC